MAIRLTKTSKILFAIGIVVLSVALAFLIWRVNQESKLDPTDSDAGGTGTGCSTAVTNACRDACGSGDYFKKCYSIPGDLDSYCGDVACGDAKMCQCCTGNWVRTTSGTCQDACKNAGYVGEMGNCGEEPPPVVKCTCQSWSNGCGVNCSFPADTQAKVDAAASGTCKEFIAMCDVNTGQVRIEEHKPGQVCYGKKDECKNPFAADDCTPVNTCDGGSWINRPVGDINYENNISFSAKAKDSDGIKKESIVVKKGTQTLPVCTTTGASNCITLTEASTETTIAGTLSTASSRLEPGDYTISMSWKDNKDATSAACALTTSFAVLPKETNPDWSITKGVVEQCIDDSTENPKAELTYTITVKNTGDGAGTITKIEDVLDTKVQSSFIQTSTITSPGAYASGKITWNYSTPLSLAPGASKVYTYKLILDKDSFDTYSNSVTLTPVGSDAIIATANITADCVITETPETPETPVTPTEGTVPETGLFDTTASRIVAGFVLLTFGVVIYNLPNSTFAIHRREESYKYRDRFEKKVANR